jgi:hypothetical protein
VQFPDIFLKTIIEAINPLHCLLIFNFFCWADFAKDGFDKVWIKEASLYSNLDILLFANLFDQYFEQLRIILLYLKNIVFFKVLHLSIFTQCYIYYLILINGVLYDSGLRHGDRDVLVRILEHCVQRFFNQVNNMAIHWSQT